MLFVLTCGLTKVVWQKDWYDKKIGKFGFHKNGADIGENAYQVRYGSLVYSNIVKKESPQNWKTSGILVHGIWKGCWELPKMLSNV